MNVVTEMAHSLDIEWYHNVYKDLHGIRPRHIDFSQVTESEMQVLMAELRQACLDDCDDRDHSEAVDEEEARFIDRMRTATYTDKFGDVWVVCRYCGSESGCGC